MIKLFINLYLEFTKGAAMSKLRAASDQICSVIQCNVKSSPEDFKDWVKNRSSKYVIELKEEKLISYEWHLSDDETEATLVELLVDSDGYMQRIKNHVDSPLAAEVMELVEFKGWLIFGNAKPDLVKALEPFGATFQNYLFGFNHSI
jgi:hypothetical protein